MTTAPESAQRYSKLCIMLCIMLCAQWQAFLWSSIGVQSRLGTVSAHFWTPAGALTCANIR